MSPSDLVSLVDRLRALPSETERPMRGERSKAMRMPSKGTSHESAVLFSTSALLCGASKRVVINAPDQMKYRGPHVLIRPSAGTGLNGGVPARWEK